MKKRGNYQAWIIQKNCTKTVSLFIDIENSEKFPDKFLTIFTKDAIKSLLFRSKHSHYIVVVRQFSHPNPPHFSNKHQMSVDWPTTKNQHDFFYVLYYVFVSSWRALSGWLCNGLIIKSDRNPCSTRNFSSVGTLSRRFLSGLVTSKNFRIFCCTFSAFLSFYFFILVFCIDVASKLIIFLLRLYMRRCRTKSHLCGSAK